MYLQKIVLKNIKCFAHLELTFAQTKEHKKPIRKWTTLFGKNGLGKSTLLQAMGVVLAGPSATRELLSVPEGWVRHGQPYGEIEAELRWTEGDPREPGSKKNIPYVVRYIVTGNQLDRLPQSFLDESYDTAPTLAPWSGNGSPMERQIVTNDMKRLQQTAYAEGQTGWLGCGYGPFRRLSGGSQDADRILYAERRSARFVTLFREDAALTSAARWLTDLYNTARDGDETSRRALHQVKEVFATSLFPEPANLEVNARAARLRINGQQPVALYDLSDGYRSMLALSIDLLRWQIKAFPSAENPMHTPGVVLIDELDAHMHPEWQRKIGHWLLAKFPNIQFIIATHSPFLAQVEDNGFSGLMQANLSSNALAGNIVLEQTPAGVQAQPSLEAAPHLRADQILQSNLFGLDSLYSPPVEQRLQRHQELYRQQQAGHLSPAEEQEYEQLSMWRESLPVASDPITRNEEQRLKEAVHRFSDQLKDIS